MSMTFEADAAAMVKRLQQCCRRASRPWASKAHLPLCNN